MWVAPLRFHRRVAAQVSVRDCTSFGNMIGDVGVDVFACRDYCGPGTLFLFQGTFDISKLDANQYCALTCNDEAETITFGGVDDCVNPVVNNNVTAICQRCLSFNALPDAVHTLSLATLSGTSGKGGKGMGMKGKKKGKMGGKGKGKYEGCNFDPPVATPVPRESPVPDPPMLITPFPRETPTPISDFVPVPVPLPIDEFVPVPVPVPIEEFVPVPVPITDSEPVFQCTPNPTSDSFERSQCEACSFGQLTGCGPNPLDICSTCTVCGCMEL